MTHNHNHRIGENNGHIMFFRLVDDDISAVFNSRIMNRFYYTKATELRKGKKQQIGKRHEKRTKMKQLHSSQSTLELKKIE